jgi:hypothetical protein
MSTDVSEVRAAFVIRAVIAQKTLNFIFATART